MARAVASGRRASGLKWLQLRPLVRCRHGRVFCQSFRAGALHRRVHKHALRNTCTHCVHKHALRTHARTAYTSTHCVHMHALRTHARAACTSTWTGAYKSTHCSHKHLRLHGHAPLAGASTIRSQVPRGVWHEGQCGGACMDMHIHTCRSARRLAPWSVRRRSSLIGGSLPPSCIWARSTLLLSIRSPPAPVPATCLYTHACMLVQD